MMKPVGPVLRGLALRQLEDRMSAACYRSTPLAALAREGHMPAMTSRRREFIAGNHRHAPADQVSHERPQAIESAVTFAQRHPIARRRGDRMKGTELIAARSDP
jgi:hypothetical protein